jgi:4-hydroxy-tetrahydrodipicolinate synthase
LVGEIAYNTPDDFLIYSGADEVNLPMMSLGAVGAISVISHIIGNDLQKMYNAYEAGDIRAATAIHLRSLSITKAMFSVPSPVPTKTALVALNALSTTTVRLPLVEARECERAAIRRALRDYGLTCQ